MRHQKLKGKLGRNSSHRKAMLRNMATSLLEHERIQTTYAKAKEVRKVIDHLITLAKQETLHAHRQVAEYISDRKIVKKLFDTLASRYSARHGGYSRTYKLGFRHGDAAPMVVIELVDADVKTVERPEKKDK